MKPISIRQQAIQYRKKGYSYNMISEKLGLSKSTISGWLKEISYHPNREVVKRIGLARAKSAHNRHEIKIQSIKKAKVEARRQIGRISKRDLFFLGLGLYLGEGTKSHENIRIINSDPKIICLAIKWFKTVCGLKDENFTISIHIYPDLDEKDVKKYWSRVTGIHIDQFRKTQTDMRSNKTLKKRHKLPYGTAHLQIVSRGKVEFGVFLHRKIIGWVEEANKQTITNAGIAQW